MALRIHQVYLNKYRFNNILNIIYYLILIKQLDNFVADNLCLLTAEEFLDANIY